MTSAASTPPGARAEGLDAAQDEAAARSRRGGRAPSPGPGSAPQTPSRRSPPSTAASSRVAQLRLSGDFEPLDRVQVAVEDRGRPRRRRRRPGAAAPTRRDRGLRRAPRRSSRSGRPPRPARRRPRAGSAARGRAPSALAAIVGERLVEPRARSGRAADSAAAVMPAPRRSRETVAVVSPARSAVASSSSVSAHRLRAAVAPRTRAEAVVHQDHVAAAQPALGLERAEHLPHVVAAPVVGVDVPAPEPQLVLAGEPAGGVGLDPPRRPPGREPHAERRQHRRARWPGPTRPRRRCAREWRTWSRQWKPTSCPPSSIAAIRSGCSLGPARLDEERRPRRPPPQRREDARGPGRVGPVVEGEADRSGHAPSVPLGDGDQFRRPTRSAP